MKSLLVYFIISLFAGTGLAADAAAQSKPGVAAPAERKQVVEDEADYTLVLKDPFSPIGYRPPVSEWQPSPAEASSVSNAPSPPNIDLKAKAKNLLRVNGIVKSGDAYVANINGTIVRAGDEIGVTVDGQTVVFVIRSISLEKVVIDPRE